VPGCLFPRERHSIATTPYPFPEADPTRSLCNACKPLDHLASALGLNRVFALRYPNPSRCSRGCKSPPADMTPTSCAADSPASCSELAGIILPSRPRLEQRNIEDVPSTTRPTRFLDHMSALGQAASHARPHPSRFTERPFCFFHFPRVAQRVRGAPSTRPMGWVSATTLTASTWTKLRKLMVRRGAPVCGGTTVLRHVEAHPRDRPLALALRGSFAFFSPRGLQIPRRVYRRRQPRCRIARRRLGPREGPRLKGRIPGNDWLIDHSDFGTGSRCAVL